MLERSSARCGEMSRIGRLPVPIPDGVKVQLANTTLRVEGPKGKLEKAFHPDLEIIIDKEKKEIRVERASDSKQHRALHGLTRALIASMMEGVTKGFEKQLDIIGVGYGASVEKDKLVLRLGFSHPVELQIPEGIEIDRPQSGTFFSPGKGNVPMTVLIIRGADKQLVGDFAARVRRTRPPDPYVGKGIRYHGEEVRRKEGKTFVSGR